MAFHRGVFAGNSRERGLAAGSKARTLGPQTSPRHFGLGTRANNTSFTGRFGISPLTFPRVIAELVGVRSLGSCGSGASSYLAHLAGEARVAFLNKKLARNRIA